MLLESIKVILEHSVFHKREVSADTFYTVFRLDDYLIDSTVNFHISVYRSEKFVFFYRTLYNMCNFIRGIPIKFMWANAFHVLVIEKGKYLQ